MQTMRFNFRTLCRNAAERGGQMQRRLLEALGARHEVLNETNRDEVMADVVEWLDDHLPDAAA